ncbi:TIGR03089 family protein [Cellulosimicrobium marinum]|uniref:TIGR03089 family protein n=1 Tax=Cellulosimicrobium marinum TaxID=1638992 RepID=UPI001E2E3C0C|nr:TIGR03089 family protein [Cellulosimicrobium marinum]MCB7137170.1 TIGR03089 family protein [Cellulosimicrobium marinum]
MESAPRPVTPRPTTTATSGAAPDASAAALPAHVADLLRLLTTEPGRPRLTWYGDDGERVELSGAVLENWVNKTTNLLVEEFDAAPGTLVAIDLPVNWRTVIWALATWRAGATAVLGDDAAGSGPDVVVTAEPSRWTTARADLVAVALPALARRYDGDLPRGAVDAAAAVMTYGDQLGWVPAVEPDAPAVVHGTGAAPAPVAHAGLVTAAVAASPTPPGARALVTGGDDVAATLATVLAVLATGGSVVLLSPARAAALDPDARRRLVESERVTAG